MPDNIREHSCPNCGAPLGIPHEHETYFKCQFCGTVLEDRASKEDQQTGVFNIKISQEQISAAQMQRLQAYSAPPVISTFSGGSYTAPSNRASLIIGIVIFLFVCGILAVTVLPAIAATGAMVSIFEALGIDSGEIPFVDSPGILTPRLYSFGPVAMLPSDNDTTPDFVGIAAAADDTHQLIYIDLENEPSMRWMTEVSDEDANFTYNQFLADHTRVYFSVGTKIVAFNREKGTRLWEASVADEIQHNICPGCFQMFGDSIVTLSAGGALEAWNVETGSRIWNVQLSETPRQIVNFGGNPGVLDQKDSTVGFYVFNITDGSPVENFTPACPNDPFPNDPQEIGVYDAILPREDGSGAYFFAGIFDPGCIQFWEPGHTEATWETTFDSDIVRNINITSAILSEDSLFLATDDGAYAIDLGDGAFTTLIEDADYDFFPLGERDGVLVLQALRTRGTRRWEIWGVDAALGNIKWTFLPGAADFFDYPSHPLYKEGAWTAGLTPAGLTVVQMYDEAPRAVFQTIPLQSGTASEPVTFSFGNEIGGHWTSILGWRGNAFWVLESTNLYVVDTTTGKASDRWP